jgi:hypothetical protein
MSTNFPEAPIVLNQPDRGVKLEDFSYLWKTEDTDWLHQREADWLTFVKPVFKDHPKEDQKLLEEYFKYGKKDKFYPVTGWFFLTPYDSKESLRKLMNSSLLGASCRGDIIQYYPLKSFFRFSHCPWYRQHMELFISAYYTGGYTIVKEQRVNISPPPTWWCMLYVADSIDAVNEGVSWRPFYNCVDYFVSILPFAYGLTQRVRIRLNELMQLVDDKLDQGGLEGELLSFVQALKAREHDIWQAWDIGEKKIAAGMKAPGEG